MNNRLRFDQTLLGKLPDEILIEVFHYVAGTNPKDLSRISSICVHLRHIVINEGRLWSNIDLRRQSYTYTSPWAKLCATRAVSIPLSVMTSTEAMHHGDFMTNVLPRVFHLDIDILRAWGAMISLPSNTTKSELRSLVMRSGNTPGFFQDRRISSTAIIMDFVRTFSASLRKLVLYGGDLDALPILPELEHFHLESASLPSKTLHHLLQGSPCLSTLIIQSNILGINMENNLLFLDSARHVSLPRLRNLIITAGEAYASALLRILPNPSHQLEVTIRPQNSVVPAQLYSLTAIINRMKDYWQARHGTMDLPEGILIIIIGISDRTTNATLLNFGHQSEIKSSSLPSLYLSMECLLQKNLAILDAVETLRLNVSPGASILSSLIQSQTYSLQRLLGLRKLVIGKAGLNESSGEDHALMNIFTGRKSAGLPNISLELHQCTPSWQVFGLRLEEHRLVTSVTIF
jgi:hypothetical protein